MLLGELTDPLAGNNQCNTENSYFTMSYILGILHSRHI